MALRIKDVFDAVEFEAVWSALVAAYPEEEDAYEDYADMFEHLSDMPPSDNPGRMLVHVEYRYDEEHEEDEEPYYYDVLGVQEGYPEQYSLELVPWEDWLGFGVTLDTAERFTDAEIAAHCLSEMSYLSFDQNEIADIYDEMVRRAESSGRSDWFVDYDDLLRDDGR